MIINGKIFNLYNTQEANIELENIKKEFEPTLNAIKENIEGFNIVPIINYFPQYNTSEKNISYYPVIALYVIEGNFSLSEEFPINQEIDLNEFIKKLKREIFQNSIADKNNIVSFEAMNRYYKNK